MLTDRPDVVAVVPVRDGVAGKSRLAAALPAGVRSRLIAVLATRVVRTLAASAAVGRIVVVTTDPAFAAAILGPDAGPGGRVRILAQPDHVVGLNAALDAARAAVRDEAAAAARTAGPAAARAAEGGRSRRPALLIAHADLPALTASDVDAVLAAAQPIAVATDRAGRGSNLLACDLALPLRFRFGPDSLAAHLAEADRLGVRATVVRRPGTAVDLDTVADWRALPAELRGDLARAVPGLAALAGRTPG